MTLGPTAKEVRNRPEKTHFRTRDPLFREISFSRPRKPLENGGPQIPFSLKPRVLSALKPKKGFLGSNPPPPQKKKWSSLSRPVIQETFFAPYRMWDKKIDFLSSFIYSAAVPISERGRSR